MIVGHPALRRLAWLKVRGLVRKQRLRFRRPSSLVFGLIGLVLMLLWLGSLVIRFEPRAISEDELAGLAQLGCLVFTTMTAISALGHRGLYLPKEEIELLLAAPVSRADLVRYRMLASTGRALFGALVISLMVMRHAPHPWFALAGSFCATLTLPILGQGVSLLAGDAESRAFQRLSKLPFRWASVLFGLVFMAALLAFVVDASWLGERAQGLVRGGIPALLERPTVRALLAPFRPWGRLIAATDLRTFLPWLALCAAIWVALFELVARIRIDFRELSLATSSDIARRLNRRRRGIGASSANASQSTAGWRVPWLFGRGPAGAIAWRKSSAILRKARSTLLTSTLIVGLLTFFSIAVVPDEGAKTALAGSAVIGVVGAIYLCAGLRFDFREDLEQMELVKSWPVAQWRIFLATLLPEVVLVTLLLTSGILARVAFTRQFHPGVILILAGLPLTVLTWTAIDNAVFLYAPIRYTPGQEGALHHTGRALTMMLARVLVFGVVSLGLLAAVGTTMGLRALFHFGENVQIALAIGLCLVTLVVENAGLVYLGARMLRRFDLARDRG